MVSSLAPLYQRQGVTLYNGDCAEVLYEVWAQGVWADLILTSPPYDQLREYGDHPFRFQAVAEACYWALKPGGVLVWIVGDQVIDHGETGTSFRHALAFMDLGLLLHDTMIYVKDTPGNWAKDRYDQVFEYMFVFSKGRPNTANIIVDKPNWAANRPDSARAKGRTPDGSRRHGERRFLIKETGRRNNVWEYSVGKYRSAPDFLGAHKHPAIFPLALAKDHIRTWTNPGDMVIDPMAGSGTTLRASRDLNRDSLGIEVDPEYCRLAIRRLAQENLPLNGAGSP